MIFFFFSSRRRHTRYWRDWSSDVCSSDLNPEGKKKGQKSLRAVVEKVFQEKVSIRTARGIRKVTKLDALVQKLMNDALTGDARAVMHIVRLAKEAGLTQEAAAIEAASQELTEEDRRIMARYMKDRKSTRLNS